MISSPEIKLRHQHSNPINSAYSHYLEFVGTKCPDNITKCSNGHVMLVRGRSITTLATLGRYEGGTGNVDNMQIFHYKYQ